MKLRHIKRARQVLHYPARMPRQPLAVFPCWARRTGRATLDRFIAAAEKIRGLQPPSDTFEMTAEEFDHLKRMVPLAVPDYPMGPPHFLGLRIVIKEEIPGSSATPDGA